jgi:iron-sulfur cluster assembly accessory protein
METQTITPEAPVFTESVINVTEAAAGKIRELLSEEGKNQSGLRVFVQGGGCSGFQYGLMIEESGGVGDQLYESNGVRLFIDPVSISYLKGAEVDFVDTITGGGFTIKNPNATSTCGCGSSFSA